MHENTPNQRPSSDKLRALYEKLKSEFTVEDLRKYEIEEEGIPLEDVIAEMEAIQQGHDAERQSP